MVSLSVIMSLPAKQQTKVLLVPVRVRRWNNHRQLHKKAELLWDLPPESNWAFYFPLPPTYCASSALFKHNSPCSSSTTTIPPGVDIHGSIRGLTVAFDHTIKTFRHPMPPALRSMLHALCSMPYPLCQYSDTPVLQPARFA